MRRQSSTSKFIKNVIIGAFLPSSLARKLVEQIHNSAIETHNVAVKLHNETTQRIIQTELYLA